MNLFLIYCTLAISILDSMQAKSCSCNRSQSLKEEMDRCPFIFKGTPIFTDTLRTVISFGIVDTRSTTMARITFTIERVFKGNFRTDTVQLITAIGDCGFRFVTGKTYFVFCNSTITGDINIFDNEKLGSNRSHTDNKGYVTTTICTWTGQYQKDFEAEIVAAKKTNDGS